MLSFISSLYGNRNQQKYVRLHDVYLSILHPQYPWTQDLTMYLQTSMVPVIAKDQNLFNLFTLHCPTFNE